MLWPAHVLAADPEVKLHSNDWYLEQPDDYATIQVSGHESEEAALAFIRLNNLSGEVGYYVTSYKDRPWFAVTSGKYNSLDEARQDIQNLPEEIMKHSPWPRSFKAIKQLIETAGESSPATIDTGTENRSVQEKNLTRWEQGQVAYDNGDMDKAFKIWSELAAEGDSLSQFNIAVMYTRGEGTSQDSQQAIEWYLRSAKQGYAPAQFNLGAAYLEGKLTAKSPEQAVDWWQLAAEQGFVKAQFNIASLYCRGIGVEKNIEQCKYWYSRAASNGDVHARKMLDHLEKMSAPESSQGSTESMAMPSASEKPVSQDLEKVANQSFREEQERTATQAEKVSTRKVSADEKYQLQKAQAAFTRNEYKKSYELWLPLAEAGIAEAQYSLGFLYQSGWGAEQNFSKAAAWYTNAAEQNESRAQFNLGILLINGEQGVEKDVESGILWLTRSAENNNARAKAFLVDMYTTGEYGIEASPEKAAYWKSR
jgi:TPR repeat protein